MIGQTDFTAPTNELVHEFENVLTNGSKGLIVAPSLGHQRPARYKIRETEVDQSELHHYLCQCHLGDDGQHDLFSLRWVWVLLVFIEPSFQGSC